MAKIVFPGLVGIHIINTCNFNCPGCHTFSDFDFKGYQDWQDYKHIYAEWANRIDIPEWELLGGEPTMNPTYLHWIEGLAELWPNATGVLRTNGSTINANNKKLYNLLIELKQSIVVDISLHNYNRTDEVLTKVKEWLQSPCVISRHPKLSNHSEFLAFWVNSYNNIRGSEWPDCNTVDDWFCLPQEVRAECERDFNFSPDIFLDKYIGWQLIDANGITVRIHHENLFAQTPLVQDSDLNTLRFYSSDPIKAHNVCGFKNCTVFVRGELYKCNTAPHMAEFEKQYNIDITAEDLELINSVPSGKLSMTDDELADFVKNLSNPIPQCKFCTQEDNTKEIFASTKKVKFIRKTQ